MLISSLVFVNSRVVHPADRIKMDYFCEVEFYSIFIFDQIIYHKFTLFFV